MVGPAVALNRVEGGDPLEAVALFEWVGSGGGDSLQVRIETRRATESVVGSGSSSGEWIAPNESRKSG